MGGHRPPGLLSPGPCWDTPWPHPTPCRGHLPRAGEGPDGRQPCLPSSWLMTGHEPQGSQSWASQGRVPASSFPGPQGSKERSSAAAATVLACATAGPNAQGAGRSVCPRNGDRLPPHPTATGQHGQLEQPRDPHPYREPLRRKSPLPSPGTLGGVGSDSPGLHSRGQG